MRGSRLVLVLGALTLTIGCSDSRVLGPASTETPTAPEGPSPPSALISDALHDEGNPNFFWLAPMVPDPTAFNGDFDGSQSPVVRICDLSECESLEIAAYSMETGPGSETVRVVPEDEHYIVNWHTDQTDVTAGPTYRISVRVSGTELGYADIQLGSNGNEVKNLTTNETIGLKDGRTLPVKFRIEEGAVFVISATDGGTIEALNGTATLDVPAGALDTDTGITVESVPSMDEQVVIVELGPDGTMFSTPVLVTLGYDEAALNGVDEGDLALNTFEDGDWIIVPGFVRDAVNNTITAPFHHFSQASVGPARKAVVCPGDGNPSTFELFADAFAAVMDGGTLAVCPGTHTVNNVFISKPVIVEGKAGSRPTLTNSGSRWGFIMNQSPVSGPTEFRNLRLVTAWTSNGTNFSSMLRLFSGSDQVLIEDVDVHVVDSGSGILVDMSAVAGASAVIRDATFTGGDPTTSRQNGVYVTNATGGDSPVEIRDSDFTNLRRDIVVDQFNASTARVTIDHVTINPGTGPTGPGIFGFSQNGSIAGPVIDVTNSSLVEHGILYWRGTSGSIEGNTFTDCPSTCIEAGNPGLPGPQAEAPRIVDNLFTATAASQTSTAISVAVPDAGPVEILDNVIEGVAPSDPSDLSTYSYVNGIDFHDAAVPGVVSGNQISSAENGIEVSEGTARISGLDNVIDEVAVPFRVFDGGQLTVQSSDVMGYQQPFVLEAPVDTDLTCNFWGDPNGPVSPDPAVSAAVYTPYASTSVVGTSTTSCTAGAFAVDGTGGMIVAEGGAVELDVPAGALASQVAIVVDPSLAYPNDQGLVDGTVYDFQPDGTSFATPAILTLAYNEGNLPPGLAETELTILTEENGEWVELASGVDDMANTVSAQIDGFSRKGVGGKVASVEVTPSSDTIDEGETVQLTATPKDAAGNPMNRKVTWTSLDTNIATVDNTGLVTGVAAGTVTIEASSGGAIGAASVTVATVVTVAVQPSVIAGDNNSCGVTPPGDVYCWGSNDEGQLGNGTGTASLVPALVASPASGPVVWASVASSLDFSCGLTTTGAAHCWGVNGSGQLGDGTSTSRSVPTPVSGGLVFKQVSTGRHSCGVTGSGAAYCWGDNTFGQLGDGTALSSAIPVPVSNPLSGPVAWELVSAGSGHSCGVTTSGDLYCWGGNSLGTLGDGTTVDSPIPVAVSNPAAGSIVWQTVSAGRHSCAMSVGGAAYCWGPNERGQLGDGTTTAASVPTLVTGGLLFQSISASQFQHSCGVTSAGDAYCWGNNNNGRLGDGTTSLSSAPVLVADPSSGSVVWESVSAGIFHTCASTAAGAGFCWGSGGGGRLGDGSTSNSLIPIKVASPF